MNDQEKILLIGSVPPPTGGDAIWMKNYQEILSERHIRFDFVNTSLLGHRAKTVGSKKNFFTEIKRAKIIEKNTKRFLKTNKYNLVHFNVNCSSLGTIRDYFVAKKIREYNTKLFIHCHCNVGDQIGNSRISIRYLKKLFRLADKIFVLNQESKNYCNGLGFDNVFIIPNFITNNLISTRHIINETVKNVLFLGHVKKSKGIFEYLDCASKHKDINFFVAGKETDEFPLTKRLHKQNLENVKYLGNLSHEDAIKILDEADAFLFPSYTEGFSLSLLEAMARGTPTIATKVGANEEMLSGDCGYLIEAKDAQSLSETLNKYLTDKKIRAVHSSNAIKKVKELYSSDVIIDLMMRLYN